MVINPKNIHPSQDFLKPQTIRYIFNCIQTGRIEDLPTTPIIRQDDAGEFIAIDGHNLIAVMTYLGQDIKVHVAKSKNDTLNGKSPEIILRNKDLQSKFESCIKARDELQKDGIDSFEHLIEKYKELFESELKNKDEL